MMLGLTLTIVLPTFNEADNVTPLLKLIAASMKDYAGAYEILFVDDSSDTTPNVIRGHILNNSHIRLIHRKPAERTGLATAFVTGFEHAYGDYICCIDSDLQHPPHVIPQLLEKLLATESDIAIASRYTAGGSAKGLGGPFRIAISYATKYFAQLILSPARKSSDPGSGFFMFKKEVIENVTLSPSGFKILLEILVRGHFKKVVEVPYTFLKREHDESKATFAQGIKFLLHVFDLFWTVPKASRFIRFAIVGAVGTFINLICLYTLTDIAKWPLTYAWLTAVLLSIVSNFILNSIFTFADKRSEHKGGYVNKYLSYTLLSFITLAINYIFFSIALSLGVHYLIAAIIGIAGGLGINFFFSKNYIWSKGSFITILNAYKHYFETKTLLTYFVVICCLYLLLQFFVGLNPLTAFVSGTALILTLQGFFSLFLMLYSWEDADRYKEFRSPKRYVEPLRSFTALLPARHEKAVIGQTIRAVDNINYPKELKQILIICSEDDTETIAVVHETISELQNRNIQLVVYNEKPINKPHGLNIALMEAKNDIITIFDAEDEPSAEIYNVVNTVMHNSDVDVVQSGVQLMNYRSTWFSALNVLEYYFWFKSALHYFASAGIIPLGGNTVFIKQEWIRRIGGWDVDCLTEDADVGIRLSLAGAKIKVVYDEKHVTQEETPADTLSFIKQRTRWNQGFIQILFKGQWLQLAGAKQKFLAFYILVWPIIQGLLFLYTPLAIYLALTVKMPPLVAIIANFPLYIIGFILIVTNIGLWQFTRDYKKPYSPLSPILITLLFFPYQFILGLSAFRAMFRVIAGNRSWEKTDHSNAHRKSDVNLQ